MDNNPAFWVRDTSAYTKKRLYQVGQWFTFDDPLQSGNTNIQHAYTEFKRTKRSKTISNQNVKSVYNIDTWKEKWIQTTLNKFQIQVAFRYPLRWILDSNSVEQFRKNGQEDSLDLVFFDQTYMASGDNENDDARNKRLCAEKGLFRHQKFIEYTLRPYSPIRSLIINSRTGSGKTMMMQSVMENFACFPNQKIILFPTEVLRDAFYNEYVVKSDYYEIAGEIKREVVTDPQTGVDYELFDDFNLQYSQDPLERCTVRGRFDHPIFEDYYQARMQKQPQGATIVLTYDAFYQMCTDDTNELLGSDIFFRDNKIDLGGAMVLVDEAHLLVDDDARDVVKKIRTILEDQASVLHTMGLFTATPFEDLKDITEYSKLLNTKYTNATDIARNHMMYYTNQGTKHMFNAEKTEFISVPESKILKERATALRLSTLKEDLRLYKHCWYTHYDLSMAAAWDVYERKRRKRYTQPIEPLASMGIEDQYNYILSRVYKEDDGRGKKYMDTYTLKSLYPKMGYAFENVMSQYEEREKRIEFWTDCAEQWKQIGSFPERWMLQKRALVAKATSLGLTREVSILNDEFPDPGAALISTEFSDTGQEITRNINNAYDDRIVVMTDFEFGIIEFSKLLLSNKVPHVILQIEKAGDELHGGHKQLQLYNKGFSGKKSIRGTYMDNDLVAFTNANREHIPVILFNSYVPEGISLFHTRRLHVLDMGASYTNISQMIGRINRLCHTTDEDKELYFYVYENSDEQDKYVAEVNKRLNWPCLNAGNKE